MEDQTKTAAIQSLLLLLAFLTACAVPAVPSATPSLLTPSTIDSSRSSNLSVRLRYPTKTSDLENGQNVRFLVAVSDAAGHPVQDAQVSVQVVGTDDQVLATLPADFYTEDTYRTGSWPVPRRAAAGEWHVDARVVTAAGESTGEGTFPVKPATSEALLNKYGFWLDTPTLRGIRPSLFAERGDARNGMIRWGGQLAGGHIMPTSFVELQWRTGDYALRDAGAVRRFMLDQLGDMGFTRTRDLGPFEPFRFKQWQGWKVGAQGETRQEQNEWVVFYAPEDGRTFALGTSVVQPPTGIDPHAVLRDGFTLSPELHAAGTAPEPLPKLEPAPELTSPPLGAEFEGLSKPVVLEWQAKRPLGVDEYYKVMVDYNYKEMNAVMSFTTRAAQFTLPEKLYRTPNCRVFNWQVTVMHQTGTDAQGQPEGNPVSYNSLYHYVLWSYPLADPAPFPPACPNAQN